MKSGAAVNYLVDTLKPGPLVELEVSTVRAKVPRESAGGQ